MGTNLVPLVAIISQGLLKGLLVGFQLFGEFFRLGYLFIQSGDNLKKIELELSNCGCWSV